jgi:hypothetical protein
MSENALFTLSKPTLNRAENNHGSAVIVIADTFLTHHSKSQACDNDNDNDNEYGRPERRTPFPPEISFASSPKAQK